MSLKADLQSAMKDAMRARDKERLGTIRMIMADIKRREVDDRTEMTDEQVLAILDKMQKQRRESIAQYESAGRQDLADVEKAELEVIAQFLPAALSQEELQALISHSIDSTGASSMRDMGKVMAELKPQVQGRADMSEISRLVKAQLD